MYIRKKVLYDLNVQVLSEILKEIAICLKWSSEAHEPSNEKLWSAYSLSTYSCTAQCLLWFIKLFGLNKFDKLALIALTDFLRHLTNIYVWRYYPKLFLPFVFRWWIRDYSEKLWIFLLRRPYTLMNDDENWLKSLQKTDWRKLTDGPDGLRKTSVG